MILAAGFGTRLRPLTFKKPKPLLPIFGVPFISLVIEHLKREGIEEIVINSHYLGNQIEEDLGDGSRFGVKTRHSSEKRILGSGGGIGKAAPFLKGGDFFLLHNGDILSDVAISKVIETHRLCRNDITMVLVNRQKFNQVKVDPEGKVLDIYREASGKPNSGFRFLTYTGISVINTDLLSEFPDDREEDLIRVYLKLMGKGARIGYHFVQDCFWEDMGSLPSFFELHAALHSRGHDSHLSPTAAIAVSASLKGFYSIGDGVVIGEECFLENAVVMDGSVLKDGCRLENSIFFENEIIYSV
jgi:mannose-1-phosphate guanylyltransferase